MKNPVDKLFKKAKFASIELSNGQKFVANVQLTHRSIGLETDPVTHKTKTIFGGSMRFFNVKAIKEAK